eukprot:3395724-Prymnesium_polylepis.1
MRLVCVSHPPTRGYVPACPDGTPCRPVVSIHFANFVTSQSRSAVSCMLYVLSHAPSSGSPSRIRARRLRAPEGLRRWRGGAHRVKPPKPNRRQGLDPDRA